MNKPVQPSPMTGENWVDIIIWPGLMLIAGLVLIVIGPLYSAPTPEDMIEIRGKMVRHYFQPERRRRYSTILILEDSTYLRTKLITTSNIWLVFTEPEIEIRTYIHPDDIEDIEEEALRMYGFWVNGREIQSLETALGELEGMHHYLLPLAGVGLIIGAFITYWNAKKDKEIEDGDA